MHFSMGGKYGDLVWSLPAVKQMGGGRLTLFPNPATGMTFTPENVEAIRSLLEAQPYITGVDYADAPAGLVIDEYRRNWRDGLNITDIIHTWLNLPLAPRAEPWLLNVEPKRVARVVVARGPRYKNDDFPWARAVAMYGADAVFVGHPDEHAEFVNKWGAVPHYPTTDFLHLAQVIAGAELFVGGQSCPHAIAEGLKQNLILAADRHNDYCHWERPGAVYGYRSCVRLPELSGLKPRGPAGRVAALAALVPAVPFTADRRQEQERYLQNYHLFFRPGEPRSLCGILGAVHEQLADRPDLQELLTEAVWMARRANGAEEG